MSIKLLIVSFFCPVAGCFAQSITPAVLNAAGGFSKRDIVQLEWSIGELALVQQMDARQANTIVTNGFLQPYLVNPGNASIISVFEPNEVTIFPNPATSFVEVDFFTRQKGDLSFNLYDAAGRSVYTNQMKSYGIDLILRIPVTHLASGTYMLHIKLTSVSGFITKSGAYKIITIR
ncbi:MAG: T9SS type A sorting domain-containing protein [Bacteroidota bacterium]